VLPSGPSTELRLAAPEPRFEIGNGEEDRRDGIEDLAEWLASNKKRRRRNLTTPSPYDKSLAHAGTPMASPSSKHVTQVVRKNSDTMCFGAAAAVEVVM